MTIANASQINNTAFKRTKCQHPLYLYTTIVNIISFSAGVCIAWTSPSIPKMKENALITHQEESWITALLTLGIAIGSFAFGYLSDKIGRKKSIIFAALPITVCFVIKAFAKDVKLFYFARFLGGFGLGAVFTTIPMYVGEIADDTNRGTLGCLMPLFITIGICFVYCLGPFISILIFNLINAIPPILCAVLTFLYVPDSPYYLVLRKRITQAEISLKVIRKHSVISIIDQEIATITECVNGNDTLQENANKKFLDVFKNKSARRGIVVTFGLMFFQQFSGISVLLSYMQTIFDSCSTTSFQLAPHLSTIIIGFVQLFSCLLSPLFIDKVGRKLLLYVSLIGTFTSNLLLGLYFYFKANNYDLDSFQWLPILSLILFMICYNCGIGPVPWAMLGELFAPNLKAKASTLTTFICFILSFATNIAFPYVKVFVGFAETFCFFAICCAFGVVFLCFLVPETKGRSLAEITEMLHH